MTRRSLLGATAALGAAALPAAAPALAGPADAMSPVAACFNAAGRHLDGAQAATPRMFAFTVVGHTLVFLAHHRPALPAYDGWAPWSDLDAVLHGRTTPFDALFGRHNEHRVLLTRLLFLIDLLDEGRDRIGVAASLAAQALQAVLWLILLRQAGVDRPTR